MFCEGLRVSEVTCDLRRVEKPELTILHSLVIEEIERVNKLRMDKSGDHEEYVGRLHNMQNFFSEILQRWNDLETKKF